MKTATPTEMEAAAGTRTLIVAHPNFAADVGDAPLALPASLPSPGSLAGRLLARLLDGGHYTSGDWLLIARSMRLAVDVERLRKRGWHVITTMVDVATADGGRVTRVASYSLDHRQRLAANASEAGRVFLAAVRRAEARHDA